jgi:hypothetical protein
MGIVCQHCGFDPSLYMKKPELAAEKVKLHLEKRKLNPASWLADPLQIPTRRVKPEAEVLDAAVAKIRATKGRRLDRSL